MDAKLHAVNRPTIRVDAMEKARGRAIYGNDLHFEKMLYTKSVYAAYAHAWIKGIDTARAQAYPGVACVITGRDVPGEKMTGELEQILAYMDTLNALDTSGVEPMSHVFPVKNVLREDQVVPSFDRAELLKYAPATDGEAFLVPRAVE